MAGIENKRILLIALIAILLASLFLRLYTLGKESYWLDEAISVRQSQGSYSEAMRMVREDVHLPVYISFLWAWLHVFGISEVSTRLLSVIFGTASVLMIFLTGKKLFGTRVGIYAALLLCLSKIAIYYSQETRLYSLFLFLSLLSFYSSICYLEKRTARWGAIYIISSILMLYTFLFGWIVVAVQNLFFLLSCYKELRKGLIKKILFWVAADSLLVISFLFWLPTLIAQIKTAYHISWWMARPQYWQIFGTLGELSGGYVLSIIFALIILCASSAAIILKKNILAIDKHLLYIISWLLLPLIAVYLSSQFMTSLFLTRYFLFILPALLILISFCIAHLTSQLRWQYFIIAAISLISLVLVISQAAVLDKDDWRGLVAFLHSNAQPKDIILIHPFYQQDPFAYYYDMSCFKQTNEYSCTFEKDRVLSLDWQASCCNDSTKVTSNNKYNQLSDYLNETIWLVSVRSGIYDTNNSLSAYLHEKKRYAGTTSFPGGIVVDKFE